MRSIQLSISSLYTHLHVAGYKSEQTMVCKYTRNETLQYECTFKLDGVYNKFKLDSFKMPRYKLGLYNLSGGIQYRI